jgi:hypothetical protein
MATAKGDWAMEIKRFTKTFFSVAILCLSSSVLNAETSYTSTYENLVDDLGNITLPKNFRENWTFLGTWSIAAKDVETSSAASGHGAAGLHNVYTKKGVVEYFRQSGTFPDGAIIIKELLKADTNNMTTGTVSRGFETEGWFVMVKDIRDRFPSNSLWGDGWGWALFKVNKTDRPVTQNYKTECIGCHIPARQDDWIYLSGYPVLTD